MNLLDEIVTSTDTYYGIVDFSNKKHVILFDTTKNNSPEVILLVISWRCTNPEMRFSIYRDIFFPDIEIPVILIPKKDIIASSRELKISNPTIKKKSIKTKTVFDFSC